MGSLPDEESGATDMGGNRSKAYRRNRKEIFAGTVCKVARRFFAARLRGMAQGPGTGDGRIVNLKQPRDSSLERNVESGQSRQERPLPQELSLRTTQTTIPE